MKRSVFIVVAFLIASAVPAVAQAPNITKYDQQVFAPGVDPAVGAPLWTNTYQATAAVCNQAPPTVAAVVTNPTQIVFDDLANAGRVCTIVIASSLLPALPNQAGYVTTLTQTDTLGQTSARSAASNPFSKQGVPAVLTNVRVR